MNNLPDFTGGTGNTAHLNPTSCADDPAYCAIHHPPKKWPEPPKCRVLPVDPFPLAPEPTVKESLTVQEPHERLCDIEAMLNRLINALGVANEKIEQLAHEINQITKDDGK